MDNNKYLNEKKYNKMNKIFKILYLILSIIGIAAIVIGIILLIKFKNLDYFSIEKLIGCGLIIFGLAFFILSIGDLFRHAFTRDMIAYSIQQKMPIVKEGIEEIAPTIGTVAKEIKKGLNEKEK